MSSDAHMWVGSQLGDGRYRVTAKLGQGGMGYVYRAHDRNLDTEVVIKVPRRAMLLDDPSFADRFGREIRSLVKLSHPHIVKIMDVGEHDGLPFAVMQYLNGGSLDDRRPSDAQGRAIRPEGLKGWLEDLAKALDFIHKRGYVHRDVKPANILFDSDENVYLSDFGIVKALEGETDGKGTSSLTGTGMVLGTPEYMAPEVVMGKKIDGRVDQYALATTVYEALAGRCPFSDTTATAILVRLVAEAPTPLDQLVPDLPKAVTDAVMRGLAKRPKDRYESCGELAKAILAGAVGGFGGTASAAEKQPSLACPACRKKLRVSPKAAGKTVSCPGCGQLLTVAENLSELRCKVPVGGGVAEDAVTTSARPAFATLPPFAPSAKRETEGRGASHVETPRIVTLGTPRQSGEGVPRVGFVAAVGGVVVAALVSVVLGIWLGGGFSGEDKVVSNDAVPTENGTVDSEGGTLLHNDPVELAVPTENGTVDSEGGTLSHNDPVEPAVPTENGTVDSEGGTLLHNDPVELAVPSRPKRPDLLGAPFASSEAERHQQAWSKYSGVPVEKTNSIGMKLVLIPAGEFMMGSPEGEEGRGNGEEQRRVRITKPFYLGTTEVTQGQWERVMGTRLRDIKYEDRKFYGQGSDYPMYYVSWYDAVAFCNKLSELEGKTPYYRITSIERETYGAKPGIESAEVSIAGGNGYRLPAEAEWEYACRAGTRTPFHFGSVLNGKQANCNGNYPYGTETKGPYLKQTTSVGSHSANAWGLYDMHGNVWEWCQDRYDSEYYGDAPANDPTGPATGSDRVFRGGSWNDGARLCRSASRYGIAPGCRISSLGFRVAQVPSE